VRGRLATLVEDLRPGGFPDDETGAGILDDHRLRDGTGRQHNHRAQKQEAHFSPRYSQYCGEIGANRADRQPGSGSPLPWRGGLGRHGRPAKCNGTPS